MDDQRIGNPAWNGARYMDPKYTTNRKNTTCNSRSMYLREEGETEDCRDMVHTMSDSTSDRIIHTSPTTKIPATTPLEGRFRGRNSVKCKKTVGLYKVLSIT